MVNTADVSNLEQDVLMLVLYHGSPISFSQGGDLSVSLAVDAERQILGPYTLACTRRIEYARNQCTSYCRPNDGGFQGVRLCCCICSNTSELHGRFWSF